MTDREAVTAIFRDIVGAHPAVRIWGRREGHENEDSAVIRDNVWAADPEDLADLVLNSEWLDSRDREMTNLGRVEALKECVRIIENGFRVDYSKADLIEWLNHKVKIMQRKENSGE